jgi:hypothetical protein
MFCGENLPMKVIQIVPQDGLALYAELAKKEAEFAKRVSGRSIALVLRNETRPNGDTRPIPVG